MGAPNTLTKGCDNLARKSLRCLQDPRPFWTALRTIYGHKQQSNKIDSGRKSGCGGDCDSDGDGDGANGNIDGDSGSDDGDDGDDGVDGDDGDDGDNGRSLKNLFANVCPWICKFAFGPKKSQPYYSSL